MALWHEDDLAATRKPVLEVLGGVEVAGKWLKVSSDTDTRWTLAPTSKEVRSSGNRVFESCFWACAMMSAEPQEIKKPAY